MNRVLIRITIEEIEDEEFIELKKAISDLLEGKEGVTWDISLTSTPPIPPVS